MYIYIYVYTTYESSPSVQMAAPLASNFFASAIAASNLYL